MADEICITGSWLHSSNEFVSGFVRIKGDKITQTGAGHLPTPATFMLPRGAFILPGFIDLQINGAFGIDLLQDIAGISRLSELLPKHGVTAFLPTIVSCPLEHYQHIFTGCDLTVLPHGAKPLGLHLEGPFLNPECKGAHDPAHLLPQLPDGLARLLIPDLVRMITLAPELPNGLDAVNQIRKAGIVAAIGHSKATYEQAMQAFEAGIGYGIHLFNAMPPLHHRNPGLAAALLNPSAPPVGVIVDGIHVHPAMLKIGFAARGATGLTLVSDAMAAAGFGEGKFSIGQQTVTVSEQRAVLKDGTLAGSVILMDDAVRNAVRFGLCTLADTARMASLTPAEVLGISDRKGLIELGYDADLTVLDKDMKVILTIVGGEVAYSCMS